MTLPSNVGYGTVVGRFLLGYADGSDVDPYPDGIPAQGSIFFTPSPANLKDTSATPAPVTILPAKVEATLDSDGYLCGFGTTQGIRLVATNDTDINPTNWTWGVEFRLTDELGSPVSMSPFSFSLPTGATVDLASVAPIPDANGTYYLTGPAGPTGPANTLSIGTVSSGATASAAITGTAPAQTLSLVLPKGDTGNAATVNLGTTTTGAAGSSASVTNSGNTSAAIFNFTIPRGNTGATGATGPTGATGATGPANTLTIGTVTSNTTPSATITGTSPNQVLNLVLAKGDTGATGPQGPAGNLGNLAGTLPITYVGTTIGFDPTYISFIDGGTA